MRHSGLTALASITLMVSTIPVGCGNQPTNIRSTPDQISLSTDRASYVVPDTMRLFLKNGSGSDISVGLRCGIYLEMFYQKQDQGAWGDTLWFPYMSLRCLTYSDTINMNTAVEYSLPAGLFYATGTFRLTVNVDALQAGTHQSIHSNSFDIQ